MTKANMFIKALENLSTSEYFAEGNSYFSDLCISTFVPNYVFQPL